LWGLSENAATSRGCPVTIYLSNLVPVWNKIWLSYNLTTSLPTPPTNGFYAKLELGAVDAISEASIYHNLEDISASTPVTWEIKLDTTPPTPPYILFSNVGKLT